MKLMKVILFIFMVLTVLVTTCFLILKLSHGKTAPSSSDKVDADYIKWVDFNISETALRDAMKADINSRNEEVKINWIELLAYLGAKYGGDFAKYSKKELDKAVSLLREGTTIGELTDSLSGYDYYYEAYDAVLAEFVGYYQLEQPLLNDDTQTDFKSCYGLKAFSPIAATFPYSDFNDFGASRSYGFKRKHLGHDMMAATGTPVVAVESGTVEVMGWNQYGGWRIGIRSFDTRRYYYYAHLRQNRPYHEGLCEGKTVNAGDVIGYVGRTGYSSNENINNIETSHLHIGLQLIFHESQKEGNNEIWIDLYSLIGLLQGNRSEVVRDPQTKEYSRKFAFSDSALLN